MESEIKLKKCSTCKREKSLDCFHNHKREKDGKQYQCKDCKKLISKNYKKSIAYKEYQKRYKQTENCKNYQKKYAEKNKEKIKEYYKTEKHKEKIKQYQQSEKYKQYKKVYDKKDIIKENRKIRVTKDIVNLTDYYLNSRLRSKGFSLEQIKNNPEILEVQKLIIKTKRLCKTLQN